ncbi:conjugal transfer protein [Vibrio algivorus]|uniref:Conjugal transfer protein n=1 Tax=Vibrio algivorus TaxID=1667024 RepID=A0A557PGZ9_9VIBR|nr:conjugal transfer protein [Vibrio algivorus]TVO39929.1 conjugal transfer protein [Vibrio algivorus]
MIPSASGEDIHPHDIPEPVIELGKTIAERNRLFVLLIGLMMVLILALAFSWYAFEKAQHNKEVMFIKMYPNGTWDNVTYQSQDTQLYFKTTVDSLLAKYAQRRFGVLPATIAADYGEAQVFMDTDLRAQFLAKDGFDAIGKAQTYSKSKNTIKVLWRLNNHYDQITGNIDGIDTHLFKTNVYFTIDKTVGGQSKKTKMMVALTWRLLPKAQLEQQDKDYLRVNPIGLTIVSQTLTLEPNQ